VRSEFSILDRKVHGHPFVYLDSAATTQKPSAVIGAMNRFYREQYGTVHRAIYTTAQYASEEYQKVREKVQYFINAESAGRSLSQ
jgi:cysteine desulfurase / selenocysteine lyase